MSQKNLILQGKVSGSTKLIRMSKKKATGRDSIKKETLGNDYWERVADDAASGYESENDENNILNEDQVPGDNERGDKDPQSE